MPHHCRSKLDTPLLAPRLALVHGEVSKPTRLDSFRLRCQRCSKFKFMVEGWEKPLAAAVLFVALARS